VTAAPPLLATRGLALAIAGRRLIDDLDLDLQPGMFVAVLGRNGSGKTLLMHTLAGLLPATAGHLSIGGAAIATLSRRQVARQLALLPQDSEPAQNSQVRDSVALGRYAHLPLWGAAQAADDAAIDAALAVAGLTTLAARDTTTLSGGELRRTSIAVVLAQHAPLMLLDEPTNHLDPQHAIDLLGAFRGRVDAGAAVVATLHDPNLAERVATHVLLLHGDGRSDFGPRDAVLDADSLSALYATPYKELRDGARRVFVPA
jgi:iron complex transport system ATP-binding protein